MPSLLSVWMIHQAEAQMRARLRTSLESASARGLQNAFIATDHRSTEEVESLIGDISCCFNARSAYIRCAVNPCGPCEKCPHISLDKFCQSIYDVKLLRLRGTISPLIVKPSNIGSWGWMILPVRTQRCSFSAVAEILARISAREI